MDDRAYGLASLLTPVIKGYLSDIGFEMTVISQQIFGGHGYIEEWGMSQFVRDSRIAMIYEGKIVWVGDVDRIDSSDNEYVDQFINGSIDGPMSALIAGNEGR